MRHSKYTDYGIRVLIYLNNNKGRLSTIREISEFYNISYNHLTKVVHNLSRAGFIETSKGRGGGHRLSKQSKKLTLGRIVRVLEGDFFLVECFDSSNQTCRVIPYCGVKKHLKSAMDAYFAELDKVYIDDFHQKFEI